MKWIFSSVIFPNFHLSFSVIIKAINKMHLLFKASQPHPSSIKQKERRFGTKRQRNYKNTIIKWLINICCILYLNVYIYVYNYKTSGWGKVAGPQQSVKSKFKFNVILNFLSFRALKKSKLSLLVVQLQEFQAFKNSIFI